MNSMSNVAEGRNGPSSSAISNARSFETCPGPTPSGAHKSPQGAAEARRAGGAGAEAGYDTEACDPLTEGARCGLRSDFKVVFNYLNAVGEGPRLSYLR